MEIYWKFVQHLLNLFIYLWFYLAFNTVQVISRRLDGRAEETSTTQLLHYKYKGNLEYLRVPLNKRGLRNTCFIALIHPIQWTIAYPVGADRPAKRQKKTSCVSTGRSVPSTSALARWRVVLPSCLDRVMSWHLFCLARTSVQAFS